MNSRTIGRCYIKQFLKCTLNVIVEIIFFVFFRKSCNVIQWMHNIIVVVVFITLMLKFNNSLSFKSTICKIQAHWFNFLPLSIWRKLSDGYLQCNRSELTASVNLISSTTLKTGTLTDYWSWTKWLMFLCSRKWRLSISLRMICSQNDL